MDRFYGPRAGLHLTRKNYAISLPLASRARMPTNTMNLNSRGKARTFEANAGGRSRVRRCPCCSTPRLRSGHSSPSPLAAAPRTPRRLRRQSWRTGQGGTAKRRLPFMAVVEIAPKTRWNFQKEQSPRPLSLRPPSPPPQISRFRPNFQTLSAPDAPPREFPSSELPDRRPRRCDSPERTSPQKRTIFMDPCAPGCRRHLATALRPASWRLA